MSDYTRVRGQETTLNTRALINWCLLLHTIGGARACTVAQGRISRFTLVSREQRKFPFQVKLMTCACKVPQKRTPYISRFYFMPFLRAGDLMQELRRIAKNKTMITPFMSITNRAARIDCKDNLCASEVSRNVANE